MKKSYFMLFFLLSTVILLGACGTKESSSKPTSSTEMIVGKNAPKPLDKPLSIKIGYPTQGASMLSLWVAKDLGIFEKYGVNAELIYVAGTPKVQETLNSGGIEVGLAGADSVGKAKVAGIETVILSAVADRSAMYVYGQKDVDQSNIANELKGKTIITGVEGSLYDHLAQHYIKEHGLVPKEDVELLYMAGEGDRTAAFMKGDGDFYVAAPPTTFKMDEMGYPQLYDFKQKEILNSGIVMKKEYFEQNKQLAEILIASLIEANANIRANKEMAIESISKWTGIDDPELAEKTYDDLLDTLPEKPYVKDGATQFILDNSDNEKVRKLKTSDIVDDQLVEKLDESGFIDSLFQ